MCLNFEVHEQLSTDLLNTAQDRAVLGGYLAACQGVLGLRPPRHPDEQLILARREANYEVRGHKEETH